MGFKKSDISKRIRENSKILIEFHALRRKNNTLRSQDLPVSKEITAKLDEVYERYLRLVFECDGYEGETGLYTLLRQHNPYAIEYALCFVEIRPYYFRSGYMYQRLMKKLNQVPLNEHQRERFLRVKANLAEYKSRKRKNHGILHHTKNLMLNNGKNLMLI